MLVLKYVFLVLLSIKFCESGRILAVMPTPSYSHQIVYEPLWRLLLSKGHHVTLLTTDPITPINSPNFTQIDWSFAYHLWHSKHNISTIIDKYNSNVIIGWIYYLQMINEIIDSELTQVAKFIQNSEKIKFDVAIIEILNPAMIGFSFKFNCPLIGISPMDVSNYAHDLAGNPTAPALYPDSILSSFDQEMNFFERVANTLVQFGSNLFFKYYFFPTQQAIARKHFGDDMPQLEEIQRRAEFLFLNTNPVIHGVRPLMPNVIPIGGGAHIAQNLNSTLPEEIQDFLDESSVGVIYMSLGTNMKSENLPRETQQVFLDVFSEVPYKVVWKFKTSAQIKPKNKILVKKWLPQQEILKHRNIKLFITQGGLQSLEEAIYNKIPIIGIPSMVDQFPNVRRLTRMGLGVQLSLNQLDRHTLKKAIIEVISNKKYKQTAEKLSPLLKEHSPITGMTQAVLWVEYVMKHKTAFFQQEATIPLYQYLLLDVIAVITFLVAFIISGQFLMLKFLSSCVKKK